jgi:NRAMP (natural resistance-associated macrophage protein)-like metal ion transporter
MSAPPNQASRVANVKVRRQKPLSVLQVLGPGLITGASDDDPSGIATYSQAGAQYGYAMGWTLLFSYPLMVAIQMISARIGRVTGLGIAGNLKRHYPAWLLYGLVTLLLTANTINLGADLGAMGAAVKLLVDGPSLAYVAAFAVISAGLEIFVQYSRYVTILKWLSLSLLAYAATVLVVGISWQDMFKGFIPYISADGTSLTVVVAILGTTISPYLFFWQANIEVEEEREDPAAKPLKRQPEDAPKELKRISIDTVLGMAVSNLVALFIVLSTAATLHTHGITDIKTSADAAQALKPIAGRFAFAVFALGIVGTGILALPVLAGSAAFAVAEIFGWPVGLARKPGKAKGFYGTILVTTLVGALLNFTPLDPVKALFWSAVINGVVAVPVMVFVMLIASQRRVMGELILPGALKWGGWIATVVMTAAAVGMFATWGE